MSISSNPNLPLSDFLRFASAVLALLACHRCEQLIQAPRRFLHAILPMSLRGVDSVTPWKNSLLSLCLKHRLHSCVDTCEGSGGSGELIAPSVAGSGSETMLNGVEEDIDRLIRLDAFSSASVYVSVTAFIYQEKANSYCREASRLSGFI